LARPAWSVAALAHVGGHGDKYLRLDIVHLPDEEERRQLLGAMAELWIYDIDVRLPERVLILEDPINTGVVSRDTLILTTAAIRSPALPATLGHELSHLRSSDSRLGVAVSRLGSGVDPYPQFQLEHMRGFWKLLGLPCLPGRWAIRLARRGTGRSMLDSRWAAYKTARELTADAYAASLGQAEIECWHMRAMGPDDSMRRLLRAITHHPPVAERIARLEALPAPISSADPLRPRGKGSTPRDPRIGGSSVP
jgi:Zn-dependent protease with chaperone function